jgi:hypothetical protein
MLGARRDGRLGPVQVDRLGLVAVVSSGIIIGQHPGARWYSNPSADITMAEPTAVPLEVNPEAPGRRSNWQQLQYGTVKHSCST